MNDTIYRQAAIDLWDRYYSYLLNMGMQCHTGIAIKVDEYNEKLRELPPAEPEWEWIPFEFREPDAEEREEHPEWEFVLCGRLPEDGQRILVNIEYLGHEAVQMDEYVNDGGDCYLDSGYDIGIEATAWMPLPETWKGIPGSCKFLPKIGETSRFNCPLWEAK